MARCHPELRPEPEEFRGHPWKPGDCEQGPGSATVMPSMTALAVPHHSCDMGTRPSPPARGDTAVPLASSSAKPDLLGNKG